MPMKSKTASPANQTPAQTLKQILLRRIHEHNFIQAQVVARQHCIQRFGLRHIAGEPVQKKTPALISGNAVLNHGYDNVIRNKLARIHICPGLFPGPGGIAYGGTQDITHGKVGDARFG